MHNGVSVLSVGDKLLLQRVPAQSPEHAKNVSDLGMRLILQNLPKYCTPTVESGTYNTRLLGMRKSYG